MSHLYYHIFNSWITISDSTHQNGSVRTGVQSWTLHPVTQNWVFLTTGTYLSICWVKYAMRSREIKHARHFQFSIWLKCSFGEVHVQFAENPHLNRTRVSNWRVLKTIENKRISFLLLVVSHNQSHFRLI